VFLAFREAVIAKALPFEIDFLGGPPLIGGEMRGILGNALWDFGIARNPLGFRARGGSYMLGGSFRRTFL
jgi:hypothetical protein